MSYANCILSNGLGLDCKNNTGGVQKIYLSTFSGGTSFSVDVDDVITGATNYNPWFEIEVRMETAEMTATGNHSQENGTNFWEQSITLTLHKYSTAQRDLLLALAQQEVFAIVKNNNGDNVLIGKTYGAQLTASSVTFGKGLGDLNGTTFTLSAKDPSTPQLVNSSLITTLNPTI